MKVELASEVEKGSLVINVKTKVTYKILRVTKNKVQLQHTFGSHSFYINRWTNKGNEIKFLVVE